MKKIYLTALMALTLSLSGVSTTMAAPTKQQKRVAYTLKNLKLDAATQKKLQPILLAYLQELKAASKAYDDMKDKYKGDIDKGVLTDKAATALLAAKWAAAKNETAVKQKYEAKFKELLSPKKVWYCYALLNDKMSKIEGKSSSKNDDDEE